MVEQWAPTIPSNRKIDQHSSCCSLPLYLVNKSQALKMFLTEWLNYFKFELYWPLNVKLILRFRLASWLPRNDQNFKRNININMINQEKSHLCKCMHRCTSYLQLATWTCGQGTRTVIFNPHNKQSHFRFSIGFALSFFYNNIYWRLWCLDNFKEQLPKR